MERGINKCSAATLIAYAAKLNMSIDVLVGRQTDTDAIMPELRKLIEACEPHQQEKILRMVRLMLE